MKNACRDVSSPSRTAATLSRSSASAGVRRARSAHRPALLEGVRARQQRKRGGHFHRLGGLDLLRGHRHGVPAAEFDQERLRPVGRIVAQPLHQRLQRGHDLGAGLLAEDVARVVPGVVQPLDEPRGRVRVCGRRLSRLGEAEAADQLVRHRQRVFLVVVVLQPATSHPSGRRAT
jgi:hypothetical protein